MDQHENLQKLQRSFAAIGLNSAYIDKQLRELVFEGKPGSVFEDWERPGLDYRFMGHLEKDAAGRLFLQHYDAGIVPHLRNVSPGNELVARAEQNALSIYQSFEAAVPAESAVRLLNLQVEQPALFTEDQAMTPITPKDVFRVLAGQEHQHIAYPNLNAMNEQNLNFLTTNLKYLGFDEKVTEQMSRKIAEQAPDFKINTQVQHFNNSMDYTLHFKKSDQSDMYFFNKFDARLTNGKPEEDKTQTFYIKNGHGFTAKEAFNQLEGRAVFKELRNKEGQPYTAWSKLELALEKDKNNNYPIRQFSNGWGYDLEKSVNRFPVKELNDPEQKAALLKSLQKGNQQQVTIEKDGKQEKFYLEAVPALRTLNIYDAQRREVKRDSLLKPELKVKKEKKEDQSEDQKQTRKKAAAKESDKILSLPP